MLNPTKKYFTNKHQLVIVLSNRFAGELLGVCHANLQRSSYYIISNNISKMKGITSTVQETKTGKDKEYSKYTTPIPNAIVDLKGIKKGDKLKWIFDNENIVLEIIKEG